MDWQSAVACLMVVLAAAAIMRRGWQVLKAASGKGSLPDCGNCPKNHTGNESADFGGRSDPNVIEIGKPPQRPSSP